MKDPQPEVIIKIWLRGMGSRSAKATGGPGACKMMEQIRVETTLGSDTSALRMEEGIPATQRQAPFT